MATSDDPTDIIIPVRLRFTWRGSIYVFLGRYLARLAKFLLLRAVHTANFSVDQEHEPKPRNP